MIPRPGVQLSVVLRCGGRVHAWHGPHRDLVPQAAVLLMEPFLKDYPDAVKRDAGCFNALLSRLKHSHDLVSMQHWWREMHKRNITPDKFTLSTMAAPTAEAAIRLKIGRLEKGQVETPRAVALNSRGPYRIQYDVNKISPTSAIAAQTLRASHPLLETRVEEGACLKGYIGDTGDPAHGTQDTTKFVSHQRGVCHYS